MMLGPPARWIAPSTPPPPANRLFAALTMASTSCCVMSPSTNSSARPFIVPTVSLFRLCHLFGLYVNLANLPPVPQVEDQSNNGYSNVGYAAAKANKRAGVLRTRQPAGNRIVKRYYSRFRGAQSARSQRNCAD